ncbi:enoyl-CoA delta isomerase 1, mitochondrial-like [Cochliomyia hominivorax]
MLCTSEFRKRCLYSFAKRNFCAAKEKLVTVEINDKTGIATLSLNRPPVNALNFELLEAFKEAIKSIENNKYKGLILTSTNNRVFCSGLDIKELYEPDPERFKQFYAALKDSWLALYSCRLPTAAVINGHSPAGGCVLATCCDFRVMMPKLTIGLNETHLGLVVPKYIVDSFCNAVARRPAELALTQGKMFTTEEAFEVGLIDEIVECKEEGLQKCEEFLKRFKSVNPVAMGLTKLQFRKNDIKEFEAERQNELNSFVQRVLTPEFQEQLVTYIENLKKRNI